MDFVKLSVVYLVLIVSDASLDQSPSGFCALALIVYWVPADKLVYDFVLELPPES